jgi:hypothetical protein
VTAPKSLTLDEVSALVAAELARLSKEGRELRAAWKLLQRAVKAPRRAGRPLLEVVLRYPTKRKGARS